MTTGNGCDTISLTVAGFGTIGGLFAVCDIMGGGIPVADAMFTLGSNTYTISAINHTDITGSSTTIAFDVGEDIIPRDGLVLQFNNSHEFAFSSARRVGSQTQYLWDDPDFSAWSDAQPVPVKLCVNE